MSITLSRYILPIITSIYFWGIVGSLCAIFQETLFKSTNRSWFSLLPYILIPMFILSYALFKLQRGSDSLLTAFIIFSICNLILRINVVLFYLHDKVSRGTWIALGLVTTAQFCKWFIK